MDPATLRLSTSIFRFVLLLFKNSGPDSDILIHYSHPRKLVSCVNGNIREHNLTHHTSWPGIIQINYFGGFDVQLRKLPSIPIIIKGISKGGVDFYDDMFEKLPIPKFKMRKFWTVTITDNIILNPKTCVLSYTYVLPTFIHYNVASYVKIKQKNGFEDCPNDHIVYAVPRLPLSTLTSPNPRLRTPWSTDKTTNVIIRYNPESVTRWLCNLRKGDELKISYPKKTFSTMFLNGMKNIYILAYNMGVGPALTIVLHVLQSPDYPSDSIVSLIAFHEYDIDIFWLDEMKYISVLDARFMVRHFVSNPSPGWDEGDKGSVSLKLMQELFDPSNDNQTQHNGFCVIGNSIFVNNVFRWLHEDLAYSKQQLYKIVM